MLGRNLALAGLLVPSAAYVPVSTARSVLLPRARSLPRSRMANVPPLRGGGVRMFGSLFESLMGGKDELIKPEQALPGRPTPMSGISGSRHFVLGKKLEEVPEGFKVAVFANGCFWGSEKGIWRLPAGIHSTAVGYCAGFTPNPTYEEACSGRTGHTEGVRVVYNPQEVSFVDILRWFWEAHDPTCGMGQGNDRGTQYRSGFYYFDEEQKQLIEASKAAYQTALGRPITTEVAPAANYDQYGGLWFFAEPYHQQYLAKPGSRPYCSAQPQGVSLPPFATWAPAALADKHAPTLPEAFWAKHAPRRGCSVVNEVNEPIAPGAW